MKSSEIFERNSWRLMFPTLKLLEGMDSRPWFMAHEQTVHKWDYTWIILRIESIELDCPKQTYDWIEYIYVSPLNRRGTFFSLGQLNKKSQKVTVYPGAVYNIKIRTRSGLWRYNILLFTAWVEQHIPVVQQIFESSQRPEVGWSGPATLKLVGDRDQTEAIAIEAVSCNKFHATIIFIIYLFKKHLEAKKEFRLQIHTWR